MSHRTRVWRLSHRAHKQRRHACPRHTPAAAALTPLSRRAGAAAPRSFGADSDSDSGNETNCSELTEGSEHTRLTPDGAGDPARKEPPPHAEPLPGPARDGGPRLPRMKETTV